MNRSQLEGVVFDADGTLLDTRELIFAAYEHTLALHGHPVPIRADIAPHGGRTLAECYETFAPDADTMALCDTHHEFQMNRLDLLAGYDGVHDLLSSIRSTGMKIAICTSRGKNVHDLLMHEGMSEFFDAIVTKEDVIRHKPDPEGIHRALKLLHLQAAHVAMIGDTDADIGAGKNAHVAYTIGITHGLGTRESLESAGADYIVDRLSDILPIILGQQ